MDRVVEVRALPIVVEESALLTEAEECKNQKQRDPSPPHTGQTATVIVASAGRSSAQSGKRI
jgi:hypothetical protein